MRSGAHVSNAFTQNYSPFRGHKGRGPRDSPRASTPLPGAAPLHPPGWRPSRQAAQVRSDKANKAGCARLGAAGRGSGLRVGALLARRGVPGLPPRLLEGVGLPPAERTAVVPAARAGLGIGGAAVRSHVGTCWSLPAEAGQGSSGAACEDPGGGQRVVQPQLPGTARVSSSSPPPAPAAP